MPDLPNFSRFHDGYRDDPGSITLEGNMRDAFFAAYEEDDCEYLPLMSPKIDERLKSGPELVSANFVIPYPPGFPIMVPGQVIAADTIGFMRKLDVKEIHGYNATRGLKLIKLVGHRQGASGRTRQRRHARRRPRASRPPRKGDRPCKQSSSGSPAIRSSCCSSWWPAPCCSARSPSRATASAWWPRPSSSAPALSAWASTYGVKMELDNFAKSLFYYLFMYGVGLRVGPSFINSLKGDGLKFTVLAVFCSVLGLLGAVGFAKLLDLPAGAAGGILAGSMTMSASIGSAEEAVQAGRVQARRGPDLRAGERHDRALLRPDLYLGHRRHHPDLQVPAAVVGHRRQGGGEEVRGGKRRAERRRRRTDRLPSAGAAGLQAHERRPWSGWTVRQFLQKYPQYKVVNVGRGDERLGAPDDLVFQKGDVIALGGRLEAMTENMGLIGPEVPDSKVLNIPIDQAEILVTNKEMEGKELQEFRTTEFAGQIALHHIERGGETIPMGLNTKLAALRRAVRRRA